MILSTCLHKPASSLIIDYQWYSFTIRGNMDCNYVDPPVGWGSTYCFTDVGFRVSVTPITKGTPAQIFLGGMFFVPQGIGFWFLLWPWPLLSRSSRESIFHRNGFFPNFVKRTRGILITHVRKLHRQVAHDLIMVDLQLTYFYIYFIELKLPILWPRSLSSKIISWIWFLLARNLRAVIKIHLINLDLCWPLSVIVSRSL